LFAQHTAGSSASSFGGQSCLAFRNFLWHTLFSILDAAVREDLPHPCFAYQYVIPSAWVIPIGERNRQCGWGDKGKGIIYSYQPLFCVSKTVELLHG
jgi:hypothetical protein